MFSQKSPGHFRDFAGRNVKSSLAPWVPLQAADNGDPVDGVKVRCSQKRDGFHVFFLPPKVAEVFGKSLAISKQT